jgi:bifunctional DNA-binding transcriptional regulator/antitoxin component of YhaV-PrlF toxin-antitoxin module
MTKVKRARGTRTRISSKHQITIPVKALREAGLDAGDELIVRVEGPGRVVLEREDDVHERYRGALPGVYTPGFLDKLRDEWD